MSEFDAILVPGGGVRAGGDLPIWIERRLERAIKLRGDSYVIALSGGTAHRPPPSDPEGFPILESVAAANYLIAHGVPRDRILPETASYDTIGNAYFSRVIHTDPRGLRRLLIITSEFHMPRTEAIFRWVYGLSNERGAYSLAFEATADDGIKGAALDARRAKEAAALAGFGGVTQSIRSLADLHAWMYTDHEAYAAGGVVRRTGAGELLDTY